jgi:hypothetical protein
MNEADKAYWGSVQAWIRETEYVIEYNENEAQHLLSQNELNLKRVALLRENNAHLEHAKAEKQKEVDEYLKQQTKATNPDNPEGKDVQDRANDSGEQTGMGEGKD